MPVDYSKAKLYKIQSLQTDKIYIGSTCQELHKRLNDHRRKYKTYLNDKRKYITSFDILQYDDHKIYLIEEYPCVNKMELERREGELMKLNKKDIVNKVIAGRTVKEYQTDNKDVIKERCKKYYEVNKNKMNDRTNTYRKTKKDEINKKRRETYNLKNKDEIREYKKKYYQNNKDEIKEKQRERRAKAKLAKV